MKDCPVRKKQPLLFWLTAFAVLATSDWTLVVGTDMEHRVIAG